MEKRTAIWLGVGLGLTLLAGLAWVVVQRTRIGSERTRRPTPITAATEAARQVVSPTSLPSADNLATTPSSTSPTASVLSSQSSEAFQKQVSYPSGSRTLTGTLCQPSGAGPFPAVTYHHGGKEGVIGGAPEETCAALAAAGYVGFTPIRRADLDFQGNLADVNAGIDYLKTLGYVDTERLGAIGFSRGGLLTYLAAAERSDLKAVVLLAPAPPQDGDYASRAATLKVPVRLLVAQNDLPSKLNGGENLVQVAKQYEEALQTAGQNVNLTIEPPYQDTGHLLFFTVGDYWPAVVQFLEREL